MLRLFFVYVGIIAIAMHVPHSEAAPKISASCLEDALSELTSNNRLDKAAKALESSVQTGDVAAQARILKPLSLELLPNSRVKPNIRSESFDRMLIEAAASNDSDVARSASHLLAYRASNVQGSSLWKKIPDLLSQPDRYRLGRDLLAGAWSENPDADAVMAQMEPFLRSHLSHETDSWFLAACDRTLLRMRDEPKLSERAALLRLRIFERVDELKAESADPNDRFLYWKTTADRPSPEEEKILREGLNATFEGSSVIESELPFVVEKSPQSLKMTSQIELERRVELPSHTFSARIPMDNPYTRRVWPRDYEVASSKDIARLLLDKFYSLGERENAVLRFRPLGSREAHFHSGISVNDERLGENPGKFTTSLKNLMDLRPQDEDELSREYIVVHQGETGTYFDTPDSQLERQKIALRIKEWHPVGENADPNAAPSRAIFLKRTLDDGSSPKFLFFKKSPKSLFTKRTEAQVVLPSGATPEFIDAAMKALLKKEGVHDADSLILSPKVQVNNDRFGFDLMWRGNIKIGFVTVDTFTSKTMAASGQEALRPSSTVSRQWEVELLPQWNELYEKNQPEFKKLFSDMESMFQGKLDIQPKYLHPPKPFAPGQIDPAVLKANYHPSRNTFSTRRMVSGSRGDDAEWRVRYIADPEERAHYQLYPFQGKLYDSDGFPVNYERDVMYAMDGAGNIYVERPNAGITHHSSFLAGKPVAGAGHIFIRDGKVVWINNSSGHYLPSRKDLLEVVSRLREMGIEVPDSAIRPRPGT